MLKWIRPEPLVAVVLWSGIFATVKLGLREIPFLSFTELRLLLAAILLLMLSAVPGGLVLPRGQWRAVLTAGVPQVLFQGLLFLSLVYTSASNSALLFATSPILLGVWLWLARGQRPSTGRLAGLCLGLAGVALVVRPSRIDSGGELLGGLLAIASAAAWAWYGLAVRPLVASLGSVPATAWSVAAGAVYLLPLAAIEMGGVDWHSVSWVGWLALLYNVVLGSVVAMTLWGRSLHLIGPVRTMMYTYLEPVLALVIAAALLAERLDPLAAVGAALILLALWLAQ